MRGFGSWYAGPRRGPAAPKRGRRRTTCEREYGRRRSFDRLRMTIWWIGTLMGWDSRKPAGGSCTAGLLHSRGGLGLLPLLNAIFAGQSLRASVTLWSCRCRVVSGWQEARLRGGRASYRASSSFLCHFHKQVGTQNVTGSFQGQSSFVARAAPSERASSFAQQIWGWTRPPRPQSVPATTFSRPTSLA